MVSVILSVKHVQLSTLDSDHSNPRKFFMWPTLIKVNEF